MKKLLSFTAGILIFFSISTVCLAGSVPEDLLFEDYARVFFGEVKKVDGESITVIQRKHIKGEFTQDGEFTCKRFDFTKSPKKGKIYLCGYYDEINPLYVWEVTSLDTRTLVIENRDDGMSTRMQEYLNAGNFEKAEVERTEPKTSVESTGSVSGEPKTAVKSDIAETADTRDSTGLAVDVSPAQNIFFPVVTAFLCGAAVMGIVFLVLIRRKKQI